MSRCPLNGSSVFTGPVLQTGTTPNLWQYLSPDTSKQRSDWHCDHECHEWMTTTVLLIELSIVTGLTLMFGHAFVCHCEKACWPAFPPLLWPAPAPAFGGGGALDLPTRSSDLNLANL